jgi:hypothetical protein
MQITGVFNINNNINEKNIDVSEYVQDVNVGYKTKEDLSVKVDSILVDDLKIEFIINYLYTEPITSAESKILITDENNNLIYENNIVEDYYKNLFNKVDRNSFIENMNFNHNISNSEKNEEDNEIEIFTARYTSNYQNVESNNLKRTINLYSNFNTKKFPKSNKIYIQLQDIILKNGKDKVKEILGEFIFEINLDEQYTKNRKTDNFKEINNKLDHNDFSVTQAELSNAQLLLEIKYSGIQDISSLNLDSIQIWNERDEEYINAKGLVVSENNVIWVNYDVNSNIFSDVIKGKILDNIVFYLQQNK